MRVALHSLLLALAAAAPMVLGAAPLTDPQLWLSRLRDAAQHRNFQGTLVSSAGGVVSSSRVQHFGNGAHQVEHIEMLDGRMRRVLRHNEQVLTLWPETRVAVIEQREQPASLPMLLRARPDEHLFERYELRPEGTDRVAGHEAQIYFLHPRDAYRFGQRLWMESHTGLLLRADVLTPDGRVLESAAFSDLSLGVKSHPEGVLRAMKRLEGYRVLRPTFTRTQLDSEGWTSPQVPGFRQISCFKRALDEGAPAGEMLQAVHSDGLVHVSVFIEPYRGERHRPVLTAIGATHTLMRRQGDWWVTVVGEVPLGTLRLFVAGLERRR